MFHWNNNKNSNSNTSGSVLLHCDLVDFVLALAFVLALLFVCQGYVAGWTAASEMQ